MRTHNGILCYRVGFSKNRSVRQRLNQTNRTNACKWYKHIPTTKNTQKKSRLNKAYTNFCVKQRDGCWFRASFSIDGFSLFILFTFLPNRNCKLWNVYLYSKTLLPNIYSILVYYMLYIFLTSELTLSRKSCHRIYCYCESMHTIRIILKNRAKRVQIVR